MATLTQGENKIQLTILISMMGIPMAFYIYVMSGLFSIWSIIVWVFGIVIYIFTLANISMRLPEKHRKAVEGKSFLDARVHRNKEENQDYLFGVQFHETLRVSEFDVTAVEKDPHYEEIRLSLTVDSERMLLMEEKRTRRSRTDDKQNVFADVNKGTIDDQTPTIDRDEAHNRIREMQIKALAEIGAKTDQRYEDLKKQIEEKSILLDDALKQLSVIQDLVGGTPVTPPATGKSSKDATAKPNITVAQKNLKNMTDDEVDFRIRTIDECHENISQMGYDDYVLAMQYRLFEVRRMFENLLSADCHVEMVLNYQPVSYFDTNAVFDRFILIMRRPYSEEFMFQEQSGQHEGYSVKIQAAPCAMVTAGWATSEIPIFMLIYSPADADTKMDVIINEKQLNQTVKQTLSRLVDWYKTEYENAELDIEEERSLAQHYLMKWDDLKQQIEEGSWEPEKDELTYTEKIIRVVPNSAKAYMFIITVGFIIALVVCIMYANVNSLLRAGG